MNIIEEIKNNLPLDIRKYILLDYALPGKSNCYVRCSNMECDVKFETEGDIKAFFSLKKRTAKRMKDSITGEYYLTCLCDQCYEKKLALELKRKKEKEKIEEERKASRERRDREKIERESIMRSPQRTFSTHTPLRYHYQTVTPYRSSPSTSSNTGLPYLDNIINVMRR